MLSSLLCTGGMGTAFSIPRTSDDFLSNMEDMEISDVGMSDELHITLSSYHIEVRYLMCLIDQCI